MCLSVFLTAELSKTREVGEVGFFAGGRLSIRMVNRKKFSYFEVGKNTCTILATLNRTVNGVRFVLLVKIVEKCSPTIGTIHHSPL